MRFILVSVTIMKGIGKAQHAWHDSHAASVDSAEKIS